MTPKELNKENQALRLKIQELQRELATERAKPEKKWPTHTAVAETHAAPEKKVDSAKTRS